MIDFIEAICFVGIMICFCSIMYVNLRPQEDPDYA